LIIPKTYGEPVAFFGVPNTEPPAATAVLLDAGALEPVELVELVELLELQAAAVSVSTAAAATLSHLVGFICASFEWCVSVGADEPAAARSGGRLPEVTGGE
jgi:hypothetical protein